MSEMSKIKGAIALWVLMLLIFGANSYYLYYKYIPTILSPYADTPVIYAHVQKALYVVAAESRYWFMTLEGCITGLIIGYYIQARKKRKPGTTQ